MLRKKEMKKYIGIAVLCGTLVYIIKNYKDYTDVLAAEISQFKATRDALLKWQETPNEQ